MTTLHTTSTVHASRVAVHVHTRRELLARLPALDDYVRQGQLVSVSRLPSWLPVLQQSMFHEPIALEATRGGAIVGVLCLSFMSSRLFGKFLVSLPYVSSGGVIADDSNVATALVDRAAIIADELNVRYLELRHEWPLEHTKLAHLRTDKVHMRMDLPTSGAVLWEQMTAKVRNQVRKGQKNGFAIHWGGLNLLADFYQVFSHNMRDLGTPTFGRGLFEAILRQYADVAEICVLRDGERAISAALVLHGRGISEVPSASTLKCYNPSCANMLLYWAMLERCAERGQSIFDFGRSSEDSPTHRFKKQWGATPSQAAWQYYLRTGSVSDMRPDHPKYRRMIAIWQRLPVGLTRILGPRIVRGIP